MNAPVNLGQLIFARRGPGFKKMSERGGLGPGRMGM
jgi:hypothetical protein